MSTRRKVKRTGINLRQALRVDDEQAARDDLARYPRWREDLEASQAEAVYAARNVGLSWAQIGAALGISQQAVHRRYAEPLSLLQSASRE